MPKRYLVVIRVRLVHCVLEHWSSNIFKKGLNFLFRIFAWWKNKCLQRLGNWNFWEQIWSKLDMQLKFCDLGNFFLQMEGWTLWLVFGTNIIPKFFIGNLSLLGTISISNKSTKNISKKIVCWFSQCFSVCISWLGRLYGPSEGEVSLTLLSTANG